MLGLIRGKLGEGHSLQITDMQGGDVTIIKWQESKLKDYMEWAADYFDTIQPGDTEYRYNSERAGRKYVTFDIFGGVKYKIDLRNEKGIKLLIWCL